LQSKFQIRFNISTTLFYNLLAGREYVGIAKDNGSSIRLNLASASKGKYVAKNGTTAYTVTRNSLKITQNGRVLQTQPLRVSQWRD
ncbi:hypothetical protein C7B77_11010, partial [Chamaesiphon polymorphus CCALA 037]